MAQSMPKPVALLYSQYRASIFRPICSHSARYFCQSPWMQRTLKGGQYLNLHKVVGSLQSPSATKAKAMENVDEGTLNEIGVFPGTFIMPTGQKLSSILSSPIQRLRLEWHRLYNFGRDRAVLLAWWIYTWYGTKIKRPKLRIPGLIFMAKTYHQDIFGAFAKGDLEKLTNRCGNSLLASFKSRLSRRAQNERFEWKLGRYVGRPRVVSHKSQQLDIEIDGVPVSMQQVVVKLRSKQMMRVGTVVDAKVDMTTQLDDGLDDEFRVAEEVVKWEEQMSMDVIEYMVMQRRFVKLKPSVWRVWGFAKETNPEEVLKRRGMAPGLGEGLTT